MSNLTCGVLTILTILQVDVGAGSTGCPNLILDILMMIAAFKKPSRLYNSHCTTENPVFKAGHTWNQTSKALPTEMNKVCQAFNSIFRFLVGLSIWLYHILSGAWIPFLSFSFFLSFFCILWPFFQSLTLPFYIRSLNFPYSFVHSPSLVYSPFFAIYSRYWKAVWKITYKNRRQSCQWWQWIKVWMSRPRPPTDSICAP